MRNAYGYCPALVCPYLRHATSRDVAVLELVFGSGFGLAHKVTAGARTRRDYEGV